MTHVYAIYYGEDNDVIDELALRMKKQARMSTRFHNERWDLHVSEFCVKVIFRYEADYDDFQISFEENHRSFLDSHYLIDR